MTLMQEHCLTLYLRLSHVTLSPRRYRAASSDDSLHRLHKNKAKWASLNYTATKTAISQYSVATGDLGYISVHFI